MLETKVLLRENDRSTGYGRLGKKIQSVNPEWANIAEEIGFQVGASQAMHSLVTKAYKVAKNNFNVLIQGETGTGKEVLAKFIHAASNRSNKIFIPVNCGAMSENLLESELFGHEKGSFTGAVNLRKGIFELANDGTLFLDEVGESSLAIQVKLLRILETGQYLRVGGEKPVKTDVRVISATNRDLEESIKDKSFREDLFYRLDVVRLELPPLRERWRDIPLLVEYFIKKINPDIFVSLDTMRLLCNYPWPGNIRELLNTIRRAVALCDDNIILPEHLNNKIRSTASTSKSPSLINYISKVPGQSEELVLALEDSLKHYLAENLLESMEQGKLAKLMQLVRRFESCLAASLREKSGADLFPESMESIEAEAIRSTLSVYRNNITMAAKSLGIGRNTLYRKIKEYGINLDRQKLSF